ncbi:MAG: SDR family oxidoreductase [Lentisphaeria bacterium]|nr:SDR family oxidoreductase [Lentisphaeria bacterium]
MEKYDVKKLLDLSGKIALVSGGVQNLGKDIAEGLLEAGAAVIVTSRNQEHAEAWAAENGKKYPGKTFGMALDLASEESVTGCFAAIKKQFGRLDVLVNNAMTHSPDETGILETEPLHAWEECIEVNLTGVFLMMREYAKLMIPLRSGCVINMASIAGAVGRDRRIYKNMKPQPVHYAAAKAGVIGLTYDCAASLGHYGIRVNALSPGGVERTQPEAFIHDYADKTMLRRMGRTETDLKGVIVFLASEAAGYITGQNIFADGGFTRFK